MYWIPVYKGLPEKEPWSDFLSVDVLIYDDSNVTIVVGYYNFNENEWRSSAGVNSDTVKYWMLLPEPPKP